MKKLLIRFYSSCKKGQKKYIIKNKSLSTLREKISKLYDQDILSLDEKLFGSKTVVPKVYPGLFFFL